MLLLLLWRRRLSLSGRWCVVVAPLLLLRLLLRRIRPLRRADAVLRGHILRHTGLVCRRRAHGRRAGGRADAVGALVVGSRGDVVVLLHHALSVIVVIHGCEALWVVPLLLLGRISLGRRLLRWRAGLLVHLRLSLVGRRGSDVRLVGGLVVVVDIVGVLLLLAEEEDDAEDDECNGRYTSDDAAHNSANGSGRAAAAATTTARSASSSCRRSSG